MANWYGAARSNYVRIADTEGLEKTLEHFDIDWWVDSDGRYAFSCGKMSDGGWPSWGCVEETDEEIEFDFQTHVVPYMSDGEVLITMEAGAEKLRYVSGHAAAYTKGEEPIYLSLDHIYRLASEAWDISTADISHATY